VAEDLALENILGQFDEEQDSDNLVQLVGPVDITLPAGATGTQFNFPTGATVLRFLAIMGVDNSNGVEVLMDNAANYQFLVKPPIGSGMDGQLVATVSATALYFDNPDATSSVSFQLLAGFAAS